MLRLNQSRIHICWFCFSSCNVSQWMKICNKCYSLSVWCITVLFCQDCQQAFWWFFKPMRLWFRCRLFSLYFKLALESDGCLLQLTCCFLLLVSMVAYASMMWLHVLKATWGWMLFLVLWILMSSRVCALLFFNHVGAPVRSYICQSAVTWLWKWRCSFHTDNENIYFQATLA